MICGCFIFVSFSFVSFLFEMNYKLEYIILASHYATYGAYIGDVHVCISNGAAALSGGAAGVKWLLLLHIIVG